MTDTQELKPRFTNAQYDPMGQIVYVDTQKGRMRMCDIRGWSHLTGCGQAFGLLDDQAAAIQDELGKRIADAFNAYGTTPPEVQALVDAAKAVRQSLLRMSDNYAIGCMPDEARDCGLMADELGEALAAFEKKGV